jgi:hypothetical protein
LEASAAPGEVVVAVEAAVEAVAPPEAEAGAQALAPERDWVPVQALAQG